MNSVNLIGNLTADPELKTSTGGKSYSRFTIAVRRVRAREEQQQADFVPILTWEKTAENCVKYLKKGRKVSVNGHIVSGKYTAQDGSTRYTLDVLAEEVEFLGTPRNDSQDNDGFVPLENDDELPF